jgi:two-component system sensor histidine kinase HydH
MLSRAVFAALFLVSTLILQIQQKEHPLFSFVPLSYLLIAAIFILSLFYGILLPKIKRVTLFAFVQIGLDSLFVSAIVYITGGYYSLFSFLYLLVIIYASMILYLRGGLILGLLNTALYSTVLILQYTAVLPSLENVHAVNLANLGWAPIIYKCAITAAATFAIAFLSGLLTEQDRRTRNELKAMELHIKRVEKMAYMGEMAAGLAHEIKNPLASLAGSIQLLKEELRYDSDQQRLMEIVLRETDRLGTLVNNFLMFARPPVGKPVQLNLTEAIEEISALFEKNGNYSKQYILRKEIREPIWLLMDSTHLRQILWNLLLNAAEAIDESGLIEIKAFSKKNGHACIQVKDNGCGMSADVVQSIFDPFYTTKPEGTGLGLSIVHRILEAYDGRLDVNTKEGQGTVFSMTLRQANSAEQQ